jgi:ribonuclease BN (tRNA processing enzyme)
MSHTQIVTLGTGTPRPDPYRAAASTAIIVNGQPYLVDFGPSVMLRAVQAHRLKGIEALKSPNLTRAFLTHLHADHCAGYPDLIFTAWIQERAAPLEVYGPAGLKAMTNHIMAAYQANITEHLNAHPADPDGYKVNVHEIEAGPIYHDNNVTVEAFPVSHGNMLAYGFKFITPDKVIVLSGDTCPTAALVEQAKGCDVLLHEVYCVAGFKTRPPAWQTYHSRVHTSAHELSAIANQTRPGLLVLYHQLWWDSSEDQLLAEIREHYDGPLVSAKDLDLF